VVNAPEAKTQTLYVNYKYGQRNKGLWTSHYFQGGIRVTRVTSTILLDRQSFSIKYTIFKILLSADRVDKASFIVISTLLRRYTVYTRRFLICWCWTKYETFCDKITASAGAFPHFIF